MSLSTTSEDEENLRFFRRTRRRLNTYMIRRQPRIVPHQPFTSSSNRPSTGSLQKLPTELILQVLSCLDLKSLTYMRKVDFWTKDLVDALPAYGQLLKCAAKAVQALADTRLIASFAVSTLHDALRSVTCVGCGDFGPFLFLPLGKRCCFNCLQGNLLLRVITPSDARKCFDLSKKAIDALPKLYSLPGEYGSGNPRVKSRKYLVSVLGAQNLSIELHGGRDQMETAILNKSVKAQTAFALKIAERESQSKTSAVGKRPPRPKSPKAILEAPEDPYQFFASVYFPLLHRDGTLERGLSCKACEYFSSYHPCPGVACCQESDEALERMEKKLYTRRGIVQHFKQCRGVRQIREIWSNK